MITEGTITLAPWLCTSKTPDTGDRESDGGSEHDAGQPATRTGGILEEEANADLLWPSRMQSLAAHVQTAAHWYLCL